MAKVTAQHITQALEEFNEMDAMDPREPHEAFCDFLNEAAGTELAPENFAPINPLGVMFELMFSFHLFDTDSVEEKAAKIYATRKIAYAMAEDISDYPDGYTNGYTVTGS